MISIKTTTIADVNIELSYVLRPLKSAWICM